MDTGQLGSTRTNPSSGRLARGLAAIPFPALVLASGVVAAGIFATSLTLWLGHRPPDLRETLKIALDEYAVDRFDTAQRLAARVQPSLTEQPELYRIRAFLLGACGMELAAQLDAAQARRIAIADAVPYLAWLSQGEFPLGHRADGLRLLGLGLMQLGRYDQATVALETAVEEHPDQAATLLLPLAECQLRAGGRAAREAERSVERFLAIAGSDKLRRDRALLVQAQIQVKLSQWDRAAQALDAIESPTLDTEVQLQRAQLLLGRAASIGEPDRARDRRPADASPSQDSPRTYAEQAIEILGAIIEQHQDEQAAAAMYLTAVAYRLISQDSQALELLASLRQSSRFPAEAVAAGLEEIDLLTQTRKYDAAIETSQAVVRAAGDPRGFDPKWMRLGEARLRLEAAADRMRRQDAYEAAIRFAQTLPPLVPKARAVRMQADTHQQWGEALEQLAELAESEAEQNRLRDDARDQFRQAGAAFRLVAQQQFAEPDYVPLLWEAIEAFQRGRAYEESLVLLDDYLRYERRSMLPRGLIAQGRALLSLGRETQACQPLTDCIEEYPRDSLRYEARLLLAIAQYERGQTDQPRELLDDNLHDGRLSPESPIFRDSLFVSGEALYRQALREHLRLTAPRVTGQRLGPGDQPTDEIVEALQANHQAIEQALQRLTAAHFHDAKYDNRARARRSRYLIAGAERLAAFWPSIQAANPQTLETSRRQLNQDRQSHLLAANEAFTELKTELVLQQEKGGLLDSAEQSMLQSSLMGIADTYFELGMWEQAADAYQKASQEYMNEPLALEAMLQQSFCFDKLGDHETARRIFQQAAEVLKRIPDHQQQRFAKTTRYDREGWQSLLTWLQQT